MTERTRSVVGWLIAAAAVVIIVAGLSGGSDATADPVRGIASKLKCPACQSESLADSATETARDLRGYIAEEVAAGTLLPSDVDESAVAARTYDPSMRDVDLVIRTAAEMRISNFLLWQISYAELVVTDVLWPDFRRENLFAAIRERIEGADVPTHFRGSAIAMVTAGLMALAFMAHLGLAVFSAVLRVSVYRARARQSS